MKITNVQASLLHGCACSDGGGKACAQLFSVGETIDLRLARFNMTFGEEKEDRNYTMLAAINAAHNTNEKPRICINTKSICIEGWIALLGLPRSSGQHVSPLST